MEISFADIASLVKNIAAIAGAAIYFWKQWKYPSQSTKKRSRDIESLQFIQEQLAFPLNKRHRLPMEQAFYIYFKRRISYDIAVSILRFCNPLTAFKLYFSGRDYLAYQKDSDVFDYKEEFKEQRARNFRKRHFGVWYFVFALSGLYLFAYSGDIMQATGLYILPALVVTILSLLSFAYIFIDGATSVSAAERFVEESKYIAPSNS